MIDMNERQKEVLTGGSRLAAEWFARGVDADYLTQALTSGLPAQIGSPIGPVRRRLTDKLPPQLPRTAASAATESPARRLMLECAECGRPGPPAALPDGLCPLLPRPLRDLTRLP
ncbi:hypothetical protein ACFWFI_06480 [Streptomyces sp. NPDC060209]|uniref:hypothetical protein n=1 Tax=Streptomyces sp. NPDC060209 TaxID=3347073 RepID=UPI00364A0F12